ncbi:MAG: hypothetical protein N4A33_01575 [Bacteriovoracaceae bacterium]|jgi:hypothetical protein|nr:hypothetical protein [Bacteriovoracaceae bacterium]
MNFILKIEKILNKLILNVWLYFLDACKKVMPVFITHFFESLGYKTRKSKQLFRIKLKLFGKKLVKGIKTSNELLFDSINTLAKYPYKSFLQNKKETLIIYLNGKTKKEVFIDLYLINKTAFLKYIIHNKYAKQAKLMLLIAFVIGLTFQIYKYQAKEKTRNIASVQQTIKRASYKRFIEKSLLVKNLNVPVVFKDVTKIHSVIVDISLRTNTVFSKVYLDNNQFRIRDRFFETTSAVISDFPLKEEGKKIIKEKIIHEINTLLRANRVEGKVIEVSINSHISN